MTVDRENSDSAPDASQNRNSETMLFLADEVRRNGLPRRVHDLIERLAHDTKVVLTAQCYLKLSHRARRLQIPHEFYGFPARGYNQAVKEFSIGLLERHRPDWALLYGWENSQLVAELERQGVPVVSFTEYMSDSPTAEAQLNGSFFHVTQILFSNASIPAALTKARWWLEARNYRALDETASTGTKSVQRSSWLRRHGRSSKLHFPLLDLDAVATVLMETGRDAVRLRRQKPLQARLDAALIESEGGLDIDLATPRDKDVGEPVAYYLRLSELIVPRNRMFAGRLMRRPVAGFNPLIYASENPDFDEKSGEEPLAHYFRAGRPAGRWSHVVIRPDCDHGEAPNDGVAAIHAHLHYPELLPEFLTRLSANRSKFDLFVTTTSEDRRADIAAALDRAGLSARLLLVCENRGRDLWPFVSLLQSKAFQDYAVVGHFHGKRSPHFDMGHVWREFLWTHLVGGPQPMLDIILAKFAENPELGLVFAEEPHLEGWEKNWDCASDLATRAGIRVPLPFHFEYPMGTMFWARPAALAPLVELGLSLDDIPPEPLAIDGTILHSLERLIPFLVEKAGFSYATTHVPGSKR